MWGRQQKTVIEDSFSARVQRIEANCLRRLGFVEAQADRVARPNRRWDSHMTVVDADIMPAGPITRVFELVSNVHAWPWWLYLLVALAALAVVIGLVAVVV
jgi:uncharacterized membrane protein YcjF (UPF0283 family)